MPDHQPRHFTVTAPTTFDGDPFEVADRAMRQAGAVAAVLKDALEGAKPMVGNAEMERQIYATGEADIEEFDAGPQARAIDAMILEAETIVKKCALLARAASYDPKHPPRE